jgi:hypothetical protein
LEEATYGQPTDDAAWKYPGLVESFDPEVSPGNVELYGEGSRGWYEVPAGEANYGGKLTIKLKGTGWLDWLKFMLGASGGTAAKIPSFALENYYYNAEQFKGNLWVGCKIKQGTLAKGKFSDPTKIDAEFVAQMAQSTTEHAAGLSKYSGFKGTALNKFSPASREADSALAALMGYNWTEKINYGSGLVSMGKTNPWQLVVSNDLFTEARGIVPGDDAAGYPTILELPEQKREVKLDLEVNVDNWAHYDKYLSSAYITELDLIMSASGYTGKTIKLMKGKWMNGDYSMKELLITKEPLSATFQSITVA